MEAWVRRPGRLLVRKPGRPDDHVTGLPYTTGTMWVSDDPGFVPPPERDHRVPQDVRPEMRPDGLVAERPSDLDVGYDDPMWGTFSWVAMLDPVELSHHVAVSRLREDQVDDRAVWRADLVPEKGYSPRCGGNCCELLYSEVGRVCEMDDPADAYVDPGADYPDHHDVALDVQTGVVVRCLPVGGAPDSPWLENKILEVDADVDELFAPYD